MFGTARDLNVPCNYVICKLQLCTQSGLEKLCQPSHNWAALLIAQSLRQFNELFEPFGKHRIATTPGRHRLKFEMAIIVPQTILR